LASAQHVLIVLGGFFFLNASAPMSAGTLEGRVTVQPSVQQSVAKQRSQRGVYHRAGAPQAARQQPVDYARLAVVYLDGYIDPDVKPLTPSPVMDQRNITFVPHILAITTGTMVQFPNSDKVYHNAFSVDKVKSFDLGRYTTGKSKSVFFDQPGPVQVFCEIHSSMSAVVMVFPHNFYQVINADGTFRFENIPPGTYQLRVWHEFKPLQSRPATITGSETQTYDFSL